MPAKKGGGNSVIAGSLPWGQGGGGMFDYMSSSDPEKALAAHYNQAYNSALAMNQQNYANILRGYQQTAAAQMGSQRGISKGYKGLMDSVLGKIASVGQSDRQYLNDLYTSRQGDAAQNLIGTGLGNSTVTSAVNRGLTLDEAKANLQLSEQLSKMYAGYQTDIGSKHLAYRERASDARQGQSNQQLNWMNSIQAQYPDASAYSQIAQGLGAAEEAQKQRDFIESQMWMSARGGEGAFGTPFGGAGMGGLNAHNARQYALSQLSQGGAFQGPQGNPQSGGMPSYQSVPQSQIGGYNPFSFAGSGGSGNPYGAGGPLTQGGPTGGSPQMGFNIGLGGYASAPYMGGLGGNPYGAGGSGFGGGFGSSGGYVTPSPAYAPQAANITALGQSVAQGLSGAFW
jgi:hypothetical protein